MGKGLLASLVLALAMPAATVGYAGGPLLPCGATGDFVLDQRQVADVFEFVKGVCEQLGESCSTGEPLPTSCESVECQRAVQLARDSCNLSFAKSGFLKDAFEPILDAAVAVCASRTPQVADGQVRSSW